MSNSRADKPLQNPPVSTNNNFHLVRPVINPRPLYSFTGCLNSETWQYCFTMYLHRDWKPIQKNKVLKKSPQNKHVPEHSVQTWVTNPLKHQSGWKEWGKGGTETDKLQKEDSYGTCLGKPSELHIHLFHINLSPLGFSPIINAALKQKVQIKASTTFGKDKLLLYRR